MEQKSIRTKKSQIGTTAHSNALDPWGYVVAELILEPLIAVLCDGTPVVEDG